MVFKRKYTKETYEYVNMYDDNLVLMQMPQVRATTMAQEGKVRYKT